MSKNVLILTRTAMLLALTLLFQIFGHYIPLGPNSNFIVGPLVNACLLIATSMVGFWSGTVIAVVAPVAAVFTSHSAVSTFLLPFFPFVAAGNFVLVLMFYIFRNRSKIAGLILGAIVKFAVLLGSVNLCLHIIGGVFKVNAKVAVQLATFLFSWPQLVTALVGGIIAFIVLKAVDKSFKIN